MTGVVRVLVVEDGDEYLTNLTTFVADGFSYAQAKSGRSACEMLARERFDLVYLDMRFDRTAYEDLLGDLVALTARFNGDIGRARRFQQDNQGLFILRALRAAGFTGPVVLSYDFSLEERRFAALRAQDPSLFYCPDYADAGTIRTTILDAVAFASGRASG
ncbi:MAG: response regulator [Deltaproteobacteria bacterium]|nr:MAG: response regulator [Deltaproteobacteria bacterium]